MFFDIFSETPSLNKVQALDELYGAISFKLFDMKLVIEISLGKKTNVDKELDKDTEHSKNNIYFFILFISDQGKSNF